MGPRGPGRLRYLAGTHALDEGRGAGPLQNRLLRKKQIPQPEIKFVTQIRGAAVNTNLRRASDSESRFCLRKQMSESRSGPCLDPRRFEIHEPIPEQPRQIPESRFENQIHGSRSGRACGQKQILGERPDSGIRSGGGQADSRIEIRKPDPRKQIRVCMRGKADPGREARF